MEEDIVFKARVDGAKSLADLKKLWKEQQAELQNTVKGTEDYTRALHRLGAVKDEISDLRSTINALNPEGKVGAFVNVAGKLAGGFQAATGAAALFGVKSEELEQTLLKVQAATAFAEGIRSIAGMGDSFRVLGTVIKTNVVTALGTLKGALAATGIGALVVAIGILINEVMEYNEAIEEEYDKQRKLNEELKKTTDEYLKQAAASEELRNRRKGGINELERELKLMEAQGASADALASKKQQILDKEIENLKILRATVYDNAAEVDKINEKILDKENEKTAVFEANEKRKRDAAAETAKQLREQREREEVDAYERSLREREKNAKEGEELKEKFLKDRQEKWDLEEEERLKKEKEAADWQAKLDKAELYSLEQREKARRDVEADEIATAQRIATAKSQIESTAFKAARDLSNAFFQSKLNGAKGNAQAELEIRKKQFAVEKAFNIARATIDGARAVLTALASSPPPFNAILATVSGIAAAAQIAVISSQKFDGGGGGFASIQTPNISVPNAPTTRTDAPRINNVDSTRLNEKGQVLSVEVNANILETQMSKSQERIKRLKRQSTFG